MNSSPPADFTAFTVTAIVATQCTKAWSIPGNDAQVGTTYRLTFSGTGNQGTTTAEILEFQVSGFANAKISQTFAGVNQPFDWKVVAEVTIITTGLTGTANFSVWCSAGGGDNNGYSHAGAFDTTNTFTLEGQALWGGNTGGGQTITCDQSFVERIGP